MDISTRLVRRLLTAQFPWWAGLPLPVPVLLEQGVPSEGYLVALERVPVASR